MATANNVALYKLTRIRKPATGLATGVQQVTNGLTGGVSASLSSWLLHTSGSYNFPMLVIVVFLPIDAASTAIVLRPKWSRHQREPAAALGP